MDISFIAPPGERIRFNLSGIFPLPPLGLAYLAAVSRREGFDVEIIDMVAAGKPWTTFSERLQKSRPVLVGISATIFSLSQAFLVAERTKEILPGVKIVLGGPATVFTPEEIMKRCSSIDYVVIGEGERAILHLARSIVKGKSEGVDAFAGLAIRVGNSINITPPGPPVDMNTLPPPARDLLPNPSYRMHPPFGLRPPATLVETARGCPYSCNFCTIPNKIRMRSPGMVMEEIEDLSGKYGIREIHFIDPTFTWQKKRIHEICDGFLAMSEKTRPVWSCKTRPDCVDESLLEHMAEAGCFMISYGVESGSQTILDNLSKGMVVDEMERIVRATRHVGIGTLIYMLIGSPGETDESIKESFSLVKKMSPDYVLYGELLPDPASKLTLDAISEGRFTADDVAAFYIDRIKGPFEDMTLTGLPRKKVEKWLRRAVGSFYFSPGFLLRQLLSPGGLRQARRRIGAGTVLVRELLFHTFRKNSF